MKVVFLGVGDAFDTKLPNNSHLILSETKLLLDCGYSIPQALWQYSEDPELLDAIFVSHIHADHSFGLPAIIGRMAEEGRKKPLTILCTKETTESVKQILTIGYPGLLKKFIDKIEYSIVDEKSHIKLNELELSFAMTEHSTKNLAIRVSDTTHSICYSGDGRATAACEELYKDADLLIHETFLIDEEKAGHSSIKQLLRVVERAKVKRLALTHLSRNVRLPKAEEIKKAVEGAVCEVLIPEAGEEYTL